MKRIFEAALNALFPKRVACIFCDKEARVNEHGLCEDCEREAALHPEVKAPDMLEGMCAGAVYSGTPVFALHKLKYEDARYLGEAFAGLIEIPSEWGIELIVPVPLHKKKLDSRGYNQSALIAKALAERFNFEYNESILARTKNTPTQTKLGRKERRENVRDAFRASDGVEGKTILVVDDMSTTGATLSECARALRNAGAKKVYGASACISEISLKEQIY